MLELILVLLIGFLSSFVGTNVGGGGLISIPALIFLGIPAQIAIATNKLGSIGMILSGVYKFHNDRKIDYKISIPISIFSFIGAYIGANTLLIVPTNILEQLVGIFILGILVFTLWQRKMGTKITRSISSVKKYSGYLGFIFVGFWGAFFGGGFGTFSIFLLLSLFGKTFLESAGITHLLSIGISVMSIIIFGSKGIIDWQVGIVLLLGMLIGSYIGASYGIKKGDEWVRKLFIIVVILSAIKLLV